MKEIKYTILYCVCENFSDSILLRFRFRNCNNYGSGSASQKVTVPTGTVPQRCSPCLEILKNHLRPSIERNGRSGAMHSDRVGQELSQK